MSIAAHISRVLERTAIETARWTERLEGWADDWAKRHTGEVDSCGYCGVPPTHWPWCPLLPVSEMAVIQRRIDDANSVAFKQGVQAGILSVSDGETIVDPYERVQSTEGPADCVGWGE